MTAPSSGTKTASSSRAINPFVRQGIIIAAAALLGGLGTRWITSRVADSPKRHTSQHGDENPATTAANSNEPSSAIAKLPSDQWESAGIQLSPAIQTDFSKQIGVTGKISLNEDRIAHIYPMVEGTVDQVSVALGQNVKTDDLLVVIHSREIGTAKLDLYQARLQRELASVKLGIQENITANTKQLIAALRANQPITEIEQRFRSNAMGDYRERLLASYASYIKAQADLSRLEGVRDSGAVSSKVLLTAQASRDANLATFQSRIEQIEYEMKTSQLLASQDLKEAETKIAVASTNLRILGCSQEDIDSIDPANQGEAISHYPITAPFDGTVITKDVALREQVRQSTSVLTIADLSTVWITADVYEENVPLLRSLSDKTITLRNEAWPDRTFDAKVFYTGEIMDEATRTISMRATADNSERLLKPGMFVTIDLPGITESNVFTLPINAVLEHEGKSFVFIHIGGDTFERRDVKLGPTNGKVIVIRSGVASGESVVVDGGFILKSRLLAELMGGE
ncbi:MAG: efflux RND transporter periplasmic adaptor subunit [Planctomycetes bacterium]|nr:efflux RND transporter periplasmic adaptor subunit [Planctomycetota bacterium]